MPAPADSGVRNRLLAALPATDYAVLEPHLQPVPLKLHQVLIAAHRPIAYVYFPLSGLVSTLVQTDANRVEVGLVGREGLVGTPIILGTNQSARASIVQSAGGALRIRAQTLRRALDARPSLFRPFGLYVQALLAQMAQTIHAATVLSVEQRLARWLLMAHDRADDDELSLTHGFLADMLGVRRPSVTTATHVLEGRGMISARRGHIIIVDRAKLLALVGDAYQAAEDEYASLLAPLTQET